MNYAMQTNEIVAYMVEQATIQAMKEKTQFTILGFIDGEIHTYVFGSWVVL